MRLSLPNTLFCILLVCRTGSSLFVTQGSPCYSVCNAGGLGSGDTTASDVVCTDDAFALSQPGMRYQSCVSCLQLSTATAAQQNDQNTFLFNLRYSLATCLFMPRNNTTKVLDPCAEDQYCGPIKSPLQGGGLVAANSSNDNQYNYCSADEHAFLGYEGYSSCSQCLDREGEKILKNFYVALRTACTQEPPVGTLIGLNSSVFSLAPVIATSPGQNFSSKAAESSSSSGLDLQQIIGISVSIAVVFILSAVALLVVCIRHSGARQKKTLHSPLNTRYGSKDISAPIEGAFGSPPPPFTPFYDKSPRYIPDSYFELTTAKDVAEGSTMPTHQAYINQSGARRKDSSASVTAPSAVLSRAPSYTDASSSPSFHLQSSSKSRPPPIKIPSKANGSPNFTAPSYQPNSGVTSIGSSGGSSAGKRFSPGRGGIGATMSVTKASEDAHQAARQREMRARQGPVRQAPPEKTYTTIEDDDDSLW